MRILTLFALLLFVTSIGFADTVHSNFDELDKNNSKLKPVTTTKPMAMQPFTPQDENAGTSESDPQPHGRKLFVDSIKNHSLPLYGGSEWRMIDIGMIYATALDVPEVMKRLTEGMSSKCQREISGFQNYDRYGSVLDNFHIERMSSSQYNIAYGNLYCFGRKTQ